MRWVARPPRTKKHEENSDPIAIYNVKQKKESWNAKLNLIV